MRNVWKIGTALLLCLTLLCGIIPVCTAAPANLIQNGDGELGTLQYWTYFQSTAISKSAAHSGVYGFHLKGNGGWGALMEQTINVSVGQEYHLEFWYKANSNGTNWKLVKGDGSGNYGSAWVTATSWTKVTFNFTATQAKVTLNFSGGGNGIAEDIYVDDISITEVVPAAKGEIQNGSFENGDDGWTLTGKCAVVEGDAYHGTKAVRLEHTQMWAEALTQTLPVEKNTDYTISFYTKRVSGTGAWNLCLMDGKKQYQFTTQGDNWFKQTTKNWEKVTVTFNSGNYDSLFVKIQPESTSSGVFLLDYMTLAKKGSDPVVPDEPVTPPANPPYMTSYGVVMNRPTSADKNLLKGAGFESGTFGFNHSSITSVTDSTAPQGKKSLYFKTSKTTVVKEIVWVDVKANTNYIFSTWIKGAYISKDNPLYNATVGIVDESGTFLSMEEWVFLNGERQIVPTAWDNAWHLRAIQFNSADATRVGICLSGSGSQLWLDDMALYKVGDGKKYVSANMAGAISLSFEEAIPGCADKNNLITDGSFSTKDKSGFWAESHGWRNGFLTFVENDYEYGTSMKYTASGRDSALSTIKWIDVKANTDYTVSVDMRILKSGNGRLVLLDDKLREKQEFLYITFDRSAYDQDDAQYGWYSLSCSFNTDVYTRIGICIVDDGGEVLLDNMRLFKTSQADASVKDTFTPSPEAPNPEDYPDGADDPVETPDDPDTPVVPFDPTNPGGTITPDDPNGGDGDEGGSGSNGSGSNGAGSPTKADGSAAKVNGKGGKDGQSPRVWVWLLPVLAVVLIGGAVVVVLFIRKKKQPVTAPAETPEPPAE